MTDQGVGSVLQAASMGHVKHVCKVVVRKHDWKSSFGDVEVNKNCIIKILLMYY